MDLPEIPFQSDHVEGVTGPAATRDQPKKNLKAAETDLIAALKDAGTPDEKITTIVADYVRARRRPPPDPRVLQIVAGKAVAGPDENLDPPLPAGLPQEFAEYICGVADWNVGNVKLARQHWQKIIRLPNKQSKYRSVWAAYMIGRSYVESDPTQAITYFQLCRALAAKGFADSTHLAAASLGWQAKAELNRKQPLAAMRLYVAQYATGDQTAAASIGMVSTKLFRAGKKDFLAAVRDPVVREVLLTVAAGQFYAFYDPQGTIRPRSAARTLLGAIEELKLEDVPNAWRLSWAAYRAGDYAAARRWADRCPAVSPAANWVRSRLLLREGKTDEAAKVLSAMLAKPEDVERLPASRDYPGRSRLRLEDRTAAEHLAGELALLRLSRSQYVECLDLLLRHDWLPDASRVATRVLTVNELQEYIEKNWPEPAADALDARDRCGRPANRQAYRAAFIRRQLACRLARLGRFEQARRFYRPRERVVMGAIVENLEVGRDASKPAPSRARHLLQATAAMEGDRWSLFGSFDWKPSWMEIKSDQRSDPLAARYDPERARYRPRIAAVSDDERKRLRRSAALELHESCNPDRILAELAWDAADLMPDESDVTARVLWEAGRWLMYRDPKYADKFYKALVRRCGTTKLGEQADARRWFPPALPNGARRVNLAALAEQMDE